MIPSVAGSHRMPDLQQKSAIYDALLATLTDHTVLLLDRNGLIIEWNEAASRIFAYREEDAAGKHISMLFTEEDKASGLPERELRRAAADGNAEYRGWYVRRDGTHFQGASVVAPLRDDAGQLIGFANVLRQFAGRERREDLEQFWRTLDTVLSNTPDFTYIFDLQGRFTYINQALLTLWRKSLHEAVGKNFFELDYPPELAARLQRQIQQVIDTRLPVRDETPYTGAAGETRHYEYIFVPVLAVEGGVQAVAGSTRDITERKRAELGLTQQVQAFGQELDRTHAQLRAVAARVISAQEDERRRMARDLHDDLGQRLAVLEWQLTEARQQLRRDPDLVEALLGRLIALSGTISEEVRQLSHRLHPSLLDDLGLLPALRSLCHEFGTTFGVSVHLLPLPSDAPSVPLPIATALYRISQEGLRNTAKHGRGACAEIEVSTSPHEIRLTIRDTGPGFDLEEVRATGAGLGLMSMEERARLVGGSLEVRSSPGAGTELTAIVPLDEKGA